MPFKKSVPPTLVVTVVLGDNSLTFKHVHMWCDLVRHSRMKLGKNLMVIYYV
jgi:hypothetical protein